VTPIRGQPQGPAPAATTAGDTTRAPSKGKANPRAVLASLPDASPVRRQLSGLPVFQKLEEVPHEVGQLGGRQGGAVRRDVELVPHGQRLA